MIADIFAILPPDLFSTPPQQDGAMANQPALAIR
jgi:hypothetical protein